MSAHRSDDLTPLLVQAPPAGVGYRKGTLLTWNAATAENTVDIGGGTVVPNLPILNTAGLAAGNVVAILTVGGAAKSWLILGRLTTPTPAP